jgi:hypothetical protein
MRLIIGVQGFYSSPPFSSAYTVSAEFGVSSRAAELAEWTRVSDLTLVASMQPTCSHGGVRRFFWLPDRIQRVLWSRRFTAGCHSAPQRVSGSNPGCPTKFPKNLQRVPARLEAFWPSVSRYHQDETPTV